MSALPWSLRIHEQILTGDPTALLLPQIAFDVILLSGPLLGHFMLMKEGVEREEGGAWNTIDDISAAFMFSFCACLQLRKILLLHYRYWGIIINLPSELTALREMLPLASLTSVVRRAHFGSSIDV